jgi:hypothetical protein
MDEYLRKKAFYLVYKYFPTGLSLFWPCSNQHSSPPFIPAGFACRGCRSAASRFCQPVMSRLVRSVCMRCRLVMTGEDTNSSAYPLRSSSPSLVTSTSQSVISIPCNYVHTYIHPPHLSLNPPISG